MICVGAWAIACKRSARCGQRVRNVPSRRSFSPRRLFPVSAPPKAAHYVSNIAAGKRQGEAAQLGVGDAQA